MKRTLLAALTTLALVGCSHANKDTSTASAEGADEKTESVAHSADERVQAQDSRQASDSTVYKGPDATGGSGSDVVNDPSGGAATPVDNAPNQGIHPTDTGTKDDGNTSASAATDGSGNMATRTDGSGTGGSGELEPKSEVKEEEGTGGSGSTGTTSGTTTGSSTMDSSMDATGGSGSTTGSTAGTGSMDTTTSTTTKTAPCPDPSMKK
jgi:hypothetical protein